MIFEPLPNKRYSILLCDPPWAFSTWGGKNVTPHRTEEDHYPTVEAKTLGEIPVGDIAADNSALFMWVISSHIPQAIELAADWGFEFKTDCFTWLKTSAKTGKPLMSMGYYSRKYTEKCFLFTRGRGLKRLDAGVPELIVAPRREHSRKPDQQYDYIERLFGKLDRIELFSRQSRPGWDAWGRDAGLFDQAA